MYVFGVVVSDADETPIGRASVALKLNYRACFQNMALNF
jgi:hypothetical protein